ncbi:hypothetical protein EST38_g769 [Candolleomyces aberdarensis]|uniref:Uncharacterized protein n=1 Tax=Candolleomyces aberdarensis TaxID=2316362 RepID=A0A4V1Q5C6_9AGAR|nr:hypothetical protein EST38_g769 [Candolleomyces aberdarensis]
MKFSIFSRFLVSLYLFISFTQLLAAPIIGYEQGLEVRARKKGSPPPGPSQPSGPSRPSSPKPKMEANAENFVDWLETKGKQYSKICFYSGATGIMPVSTKMSTFQVRFGCESFGSLLAKAGISQSDTGRWKDALEWTATSRALADNARGKVVVILGQIWSPAGVWNLVELPVLKGAQSRGVITSIEKYTMVDSDGKLDGPVLL